MSMKEILNHQRHVSLVKEQPQQIGVTPLKLDTNLHTFAVSFPYKHCVPDHPQMNAETA